MATGNACRRGITAWTSNDNNNVIRLLLYKLLKQWYSLNLTKTYHSQQKFVQNLNFLASRNNIRLIL